MRKMNNKGFSMVEILISIAIFAILMIPIVSGIISSMKNTTKAKTLQYRNEYAENIIEYVKQDSLENILSGEYFSTVGSYASATSPINVSASFYADPTKASYDSSLQSIADVVSDKGTLTVDPTGTGYYSGIGGNKTYYPYETYMISGKVNLGSKDTTYSYKMQISNEYYAEKEEATADTANEYVNPNNLALGIVEDIDHTKVALINGTIANYDSYVSNAFLTKKLEIIKASDPDWYEIYTQQQSDVNLFPDDTATRLITIKVSGSKTTGYKVVCSLKYHDDSTWSTEMINQLANYYIEYKPFEYNYPVDDTTHVATLPNIYLMYNVCLYNGRFSPNDYIAIDTSAVTDDTKVNCFVVQTAETYSSNIINADVEVNGENPTLTAGKKLYNSNIQAGIARQNVVVHMAAVEGSNLQNLSVYHNFDLTVNNDNNKKNSYVLYKKAHTGLFNSTFLNRLETLEGIKFVPLVDDTSTTDSVANFNSLDEAQQESRGLYEIKLWMVESDDLDDVDTSASPIMTATKGGNES